MTHRFRAFVFVSFAAAVGCADITHSTSTISAPTAPGNRQATVMADDGEVPWFSDKSEVPPEYEADVRSVRARVQWNGALAEGYGSSEWTGNRGVLKLALNILNGSTAVASVSSEHPQAYLFPTTYIIGQPLTYAVSTTCGHLANFYVSQVAETKIGIGDYFVTLGPKSASASAYAVQPSCTIREDEDEAPPPEDGSGPSGDGGSGNGAGEPTDPGGWCSTKTYSVQIWNGSYWQHERYETETTCYSYS